MSWFKPSELSLKQIERRNRTMAKGRKHFIFYRGILGVGGFMFIFDAIFRWYDDFGWHVPNGGMFWFEIIVGLVIWPIAGYFWAAWMWKKYFEDPIS